MSGDPAITTHGRCLIRMQASDSKEVNMWIVSKDGKGYCRTTIPYDAAAIKSMKKAGYTVREVNSASPRSGRAIKGGRNHVK